MRMGVLWLVGLCCVGPLWAATAVDVTSVRFDEKRLAGQSNSWFEAQVQIRSVGSAAPENISIELWVRFKDPTGSLAYKGKVRLYALDRNATVRFYLPPDVVRVNRLSQSPEAYLVEISSSQGSEPFSSTHASPALINSANRAALKALPAIPLLPHYATPFYSVSDTWRDLPAYEQP